MSELAKTLEALMSRKGLNGRQLADRIGMSESTVSLYLSGGRTPSVKALKKIADALDVHMSEIWSGPELMPATEVQAAMLDEMGALSAAQQEALLVIARTMKSSNQ